LLYLLDKDVRTVRWNGEPLHEATSAIVKETMNGDFTLTVKYPISDSEIYQLIQEDMLIKAPTPVLGAQLFRIKTPIEHNDYLEITAYHISDDIMQRSITPLSVSSQSCDMALSRMVQNTKTTLGDFSFNSDIQERRTFNTTETETLYSVLLDGKHSIVGTWEGELVRDNFAMTVKKNRGENRGVVITTHKNLKDYQRTKNSQNVVTRIHAKSTFKPEGAETETTLKVTVDSPLINSYPYINEKEYENNNAKTVEELKKWAQAKFTNQGIDKVSDAIKIEAYELDGQVVHMGDTVNIKSRKHNVDAFKKAIAYEFDALKEEYISLTFDDKAGTGGSRSSGGLSNAADAIIGVTESAQEIAIEKALQNADLAFDHQAGLLRQEILDGVELAKAKAEENKRALSDEINRKFHDFSPEGFDEAKAKAEKALEQARTATFLSAEARNNALANIRDLNTFKATAERAQTQLSQDVNNFKNEYGSKMLEVNQTTEGIKTKIGEITSFIDKDGQRQEELKRYAREETAKQTSAIRETLSSDYVAKSTFTENVEGTRQRFEALTRENETKLAEFKQGIDGRITNIASQVAGKVNEADFQRVKETAQLYERILGGSESDVSRNVSRLVMSDQVFQTEVGKYSTTGGPNMIRNSRADDNFRYWEGKNLERWDHDFYFKGQKHMFMLKQVSWMRSPRFLLKRNTGYMLNFLGFNSGNTKRLKIVIRMRKKGETQDHTFEKILFDETTYPILGSSKASKRSIKFDTGDFDEGFLFINNEGPNNGSDKWSGVFLTEFDLYEGVSDRLWQPAPEDATLEVDKTVEATRTQVTQLAGSWSVQNLNSAGDIINGINVAANGNNRIIGRATHITGDTLIDNAVIKSAMIDKLKTANFEAGSVTTNILGAEAVTAEKVKFDTAFIQKLVSQQAFIDELFAKQATITRIQSIDFTGNNIKGGKLSSLNGATNFNLQTGWIEMNRDGVGITNQFSGRPMQYLVFGSGIIAGKEGSYTALMSNSNNRVKMDDGSAGIQIWNTNDNTTAVNLYGDEIAMMYNATDPKAIIFDNIKNEIRNVNNLIIRDRSLAELINAINQNFKWISDWFYQNKLGKPRQYDVKI